MSENKLGFAVYENFRHLRNRQVLLPAAVTSDETQTTKKRVLTANQR